MTPVDHLSALRTWRRDYRRTRQALPWLDISAWPDDLPAYQDHATAIDHAVVAANVLTRETHPDAADTPLIWRYLPDQSGPLQALSPQLQQLADHHQPLAILHTDLAIPEIAGFAAEHPRLSIVIESGPRKILYFIGDLLELLPHHPNLYLSTHNLCNWLGLERLVDAGLGERLLFGTHAPRYSADAAMAPIILGQVDWQTQCAIAGNNARRLLRLPLVHPEPQPCPVPAPLVVDMHSHCVDPGATDALKFSTPDIEFAIDDWLAFLDATAIDWLGLMPMEALNDWHTSCREHMEPFRAAAPDRFYFWEVFDPRGDATHGERVRQSLCDQGCLGVKIHPSFHDTSADHPAYLPAWELAHEAGKPILTHSWEKSSYNPAQHLSFPSLFKPYALAFPKVTLVLGHAGGRPSAYDAVVDICAACPNVVVDLAGDYYDNGLVDAMLTGLGADRVLFGSDMNWMDPRCTIGPILMANAGDADLLRLLRDNACRLLLAD